ncbi:hypothetical protein TPHA_0D01480 [Tetrapisispora phaffii CBS 4417]|uniref:Translation initiation factor eIF2B subunit gamma n=1 Tax=Tetrapisispora phaffii (strain ATCC 24235 / CBS 4417 / NBRC 1672 / NRRL Y-8282 / UCD 70-5) TaxID=1071381 RepID=G8BSG7_TETPH|nr:hypothetical protein TPHA_0D01480 [Tetrapisispora phaffii CBS 4417]CCE62788.1 hypothetical protein TPHA_0D01480 [Tetrapisispora phaffii CBS 4417]
MNLQAFIFCGKGNHLSPIVDQHFEHRSTPKALLPIGNRPMIEYVIDWCDQANFKEINIVAQVDEIEQIKEGLTTFLELREKQFEALSKVLTQSYHTNHLHKPIVINFISSKCNNTGEKLTKELLPRITNDFVLLPCDFVTDVPPQILYDHFLNMDDNNLAMSVYYNNQIENSDRRHMGKQFFTVYSNNDDLSERSVLLDIYSKENVAKTKYLQIRNHMLWRYPNATVSTKLLNSFIYYCSYDLVKLLRDDKSTDRNDNSSDEESMEIDLTEIKPSYFKRKNKLIKDTINSNKSLAKVFRDLARRSWQHEEKRSTVAIFILPEVTSFYRANNLNSFMEANRFILKIKAQSFSKQGKTAPTASVIGIDSIVGQDCTILEKTNIKMSAIGDGCKIGKRCRIVGSIILSNVTIEDDVTLENVIIGEHAKISIKSKLTNCDVEEHYVVPSRSVLKGEVLSRSEGNSDVEASSNAAESTTDDDETDEETDEYYDDEEFDDDDGLFER